MNYKDNRTAIEIYSDIINLPHHELTTCRRMPCINRAASFSPFAALSGYDKEINEVSRVTDLRIELDDCAKLKINEKLYIALKNSYSNPIIKVTYFIPDTKKTGGSYLSYTGIIKRIDEYERKIIFVDKTVIAIDDIYDIDGELYNNIY